jgi:hypothetical protein
MLLETTNKLFEYIEQKTNKKAVFYDIEVVKEWWCVCFVEYNTGRKVNITSTETDKLKEYIKQVGFLIGFNNHHYDDKILSAILHDNTPNKIKEISDEIIQEIKKYYTKFKGIISLDAKKGLDFGLKKFASSFGYNVKESSVSFDIQHYPTSDEQKELIDYCFIDIEILMNLWYTKNNPNARQDYFNGNLMLIQKENLPITMIGKTTAQILDFVFTVRKTDNQTLFEKEHFKIFDDNEIKKILFSDDVLLIDPHTMKKNYLVINKPNGEVVNEITIDPNTRTNDVKKELKSKNPNLELKNKYEYYISKHNISFNGTKVEFKAGGLHYARPKVKTTKKIIQADIASMYPQTIINLKILDSKSHKKYIKAKDDRIILKRKGDVLANVEKLKLNSTFGCLKSVYNKNLYNPQLLYTVTLYGQMAMLELCLNLDKAGIEIVQINTDGVYFIEDDTIDYKSIFKEWELKFNYQMEFDYFDSIHQVSVNEYIGFKKVVEYNTFEDYWNDPLKKSPFYNKGGLFTRTDFNNNPSSVNKYGIINKAFFAKLLFNLDPIDIIDEETDIKLFQIPVSASSKYDKVICSKTGKVFQKNNRLFASTSENGYKLLKIKNGIASKFPKIPNNGTIINDDIRNCSMLKEIDHAYYINLVYEKINSLKFKEI